MSNNRVDGGEAILEAFRSLDIDYVISSPGSEWGPFWEALARQKSNKIDGPTYIDVGHENLAVDMALGYTQMTGRMQVVMLHAGTGLLQGSMAIYGARVSEVPMIVVSGESLTYGEDPDFEPGLQWHRNLSVVGGPGRFIDPLVKWSNQATSIHTLYQATVRAGEMAQRSPKGPTYLCMPIETMLQEWTPPTRLRKVAPPSVPQTSDADITKVADLIRAAKKPMIATEAAGRNPDGFAALVELAELMGLPVAESGGTTVANFPKDHPLYIGTRAEAQMKDADLVIAIASRVPFYPPRNAPLGAEIVCISDNPHKTFMVHQSLQADHYLEGDVASSLRQLTQALKKAGAKPEQYEARRAHWKAEHDKYVSRLREAEAKAPKTGLVDPLHLCASLREIMPENAIYVDETIVYGQIVQQHLRWNEPQSFFRTPTGLGQSFGLALGIKLAAKERPVVLLTGDGSFLYNPSLPALGAARENKLPILIVVFNNKEYKSMKRNHLEYYPDGDAKKTGIYHGVRTDSPDFAEVAPLFDGFGKRVDDAAQLDGAIREALAAVQSGKTAILNVMMSR